MAEDHETRDGEEIRSPLQVFIRVLLALLVVAVLVGLILALVLRPERVAEPVAEAGLPAVESAFSVLASERTS